jgi:hypothetical protein
MNVVEPTRQDDSFSVRSDEHGPPLAATPSQAVPAWPIWLFRSVTAVTAVLTFGQAILAGQFLSGVYPALLIHRAMGDATAVLFMVCLVSSILLRRFGKCAAWPVAASIGLVVLAVAQAFAGYGHLLALHIPLGVALMILISAITVWAWMEQS